MSPPSSPSAPAADVATRVRVDSAVATPAVGTPTDDIDESAWDEPDSRTLRAQLLSQDKFGRQRRAGWSGSD